MNLKAKNIAKFILLSLLITGGIAVALTSPYAGKGFWKCLKYGLKRRKYEKAKRLRDEQWKNSFYYLKREGLIETRYVGKQLYIRLTEEGKRIAKKCKFDDLKIKKPGKWDKKWRILIFDIPSKQKQKREALRGKIKELGLYQLQKSVWIHPYDFSEAVDEMKKFFYFKNDEIMMLTAQSVNNEGELKSRFKLN